MSRLLKSSLFISLLVITALVITVRNMSCGGSAVSTSSSVASSVFPSDFAIASPTASASGSSSISALVDGEPMYAGITSGSGFLTKTAVYTTILAAATASACEVTLPMMTSITGPTCYGPTLDYENHPDGSPANGQLPVGDLGIWISTEGSSSEACSAAKINSLLQSSGDMADYIMLMTASMTCLATRSGATWPSVDGASLTLTTELNTAIQVNNPAVTVTTAKVTNLPDITDGGATYDAFQFEIVVSDTSGPNTIGVTGHMNHMELSASSNTFKGHIWAEIDGIGMSGDKDAFSISYHRESAASLKYKLLTANYQATTSSTVIFDSNGYLDIAGDWTGNMNQAMININPTTGLGNFSYAWQAGTGDDKARIFNGYTQAADGFAFFGYGERFDNSAGTASDNVIEGFICNWAGPGNDHSMATTLNKAQKQGMIVNSGVFEVDTADEYITYAPTVSCDSAGGAGGLGLKLTSETTYDTSAITNDLIDLTADTDYAGFTAPTAPSIPSGL